MIFRACRIPYIPAVCITGIALALLAGHHPAWAKAKKNELVVQQNAAEVWQGKIPFPKPNSHKGNWIEYHGIESDVNLSEAGQRGKTCLTCHEKNDCITCHNTRLPRDHTNTWRNLSHGFMASGNRERCLTCHKQDYCVRCHNETAPRTHRGNWRSNHCAWCHFDGGFVPADNCVVCHRQAPHTSAPHPINGQVDCTQCH